MILIINATVLTIPELSSDWFSFYELHNVGVSEYKVIKHFDRHYSLLVKVTLYTKQKKYSRVYL